jgi:undecaprenyl-diphosphatase
VGSIVKGARRHAGQGTRRAGGQGEGGQGEEGGRGPRRGWRKLERHELEWLLVGLGACLLIWAFIALAGEVMDGDTTAMDTRILLALRDTADPARPIGPAWIESALLDLTAIGGPTVLTLVVLSVVGFLLLQARYRTALVIAVTSIGGEVVNALLKAMFMRPRPSVVPHLRDVVSTSFPSGHAMESAIIYLTLAAMMMRVAERRLTKLYCLFLGVLLTFLVGVSRIYLGVHYPTDVLGGWILGFVWASVCWLGARRFEAQTGAVAEERRQAAAKGEGEGSPPDEEFRESS